MLEKINEDDICFTTGFLEGKDGWYYDVNTKTKFHFVKGFLHSLNDYPAIQGEGFSKWYKQGVLHRENNKAAFIRKKPKYEAWWFEGKQHREDGPALIIGSGDYQQKCYYFNGKLISVDDWELKKQIENKSHVLQSVLPEVRSKKKYKI